jgi:hypothetical protein
MNQRIEEKLNEIYINNVYEGIYARRTEIDEQDYPIERDYPVIESNEDYE